MADSGPCNFLLYSLSHGCKGEAFQMGGGVYALVSRWSWRRRSGYQWPVSGPNYPGSGRRHHSCWAHQQASHWRSRHSLAWHQTGFSYYFYFFFMYIYFFIIYLHEGFNSFFINFFFNLKKNSDWNTMGRWDCIYLAVCYYSRRNICLQLSSWQGIYFIYMVS